MPQVLAINIGASQFELGLVGEDGRLGATSMGRTPLAGNREKMLADLRARALELMSKSADPVRACGISFMGPVDSEGRKITSFHLAGWTGFDLGGWANEAFHVPSRVENDANAGAWGEARFGAGRGKGSLVYLTLSAGIGSGIVVNNGLLRGKGGAAGEVGHLPMLEGGPQCQCGSRGCLEALCSTSAIERRARALATSNQAAMARVIQMSGGEAARITSQSVFTAAALKDEGAMFIVQEAVVWLARGILILIRVLDPAVIVIGGDMAQAGQVLLVPLREALTAMSSSAFRYSAEIVLPTLGNQSQLYGAAALGWHIIRTQ